MIMPLEKFDFDLAAEELTHQLTTQLSWLEEVSCIQTKLHSV